VQSEDARDEEIAMLREALAKKVVDSTMLTGLIRKIDVTEINLEGGACGLLADAFADQLFANAAENYLEVSFTSAKHIELGNIVVTIQRVLGKTPHQFRQDAEAKLLAIEKSKGQKGGAT
jgi:hypothetical protein